MEEEGLRPDEAAHVASYQLIGMAWKFLQNYGWYILGATVLIIALRPYVSSMIYTLKENSAVSAGLESSRRN